MRKLCTLFPCYSGWSPIITFILLMSCVLGQGYDIVGRAFDEQGKKIGPVRIVVYDQDKKKVIEGETPNNGKFKLKNIPDGKYAMNIYGPDGYGITENINVDGAKISDLQPKLNLSPDQVQIKTEAAGNGASLNWQAISGSTEYIVYRDNKDIGTVRETFYLDVVDPGQSYAYNVVAVKTDKSMGGRSITEYGKASMPPPENVTSEVKKNTVKLSWDAVKDATGYAIYRDGEKVKSTPDNEYTDFKLKYDTEYSYTVSTLDHHSDEGNQSANIFSSTHPEIAKVKGLKAESGANQVALSWKTAKNSISYKIYQNGTLVDSTTSLNTKETTEAGTENCFKVAGVDK